MLVVAPGVLSIERPRRSAIACQWRSRSRGLRRCPTGAKISCGATAAVRRKAQNGIDQKDKGTIDHTLLVR